MLKKIIDDSMFACKSIKNPIKFQYLYNNCFVTKCQKSILRFIPVNLLE